MHAILEQIFDSRTVSRPDGSQIGYHSGISPEEGRFIQYLIRENRPKTTLEVGCAYGVSSLFICEAMKENGGEAHIIIDPFQSTNWEGIGMANLARAGLAHLVEMIEEPSYLALPSLVRSGRKIDFALIDGIHTFDYVLTDFFFIDLLLNVGGIVVFDDASYSGIRKAIRYIATNRKYQPINDPQAPALSSLSSKQRLLYRAAKTFPRLGRLLRPEFSNPDDALNLPHRNYLAFRKLDDDRLTDGSDGGRRWDWHAEF